MEEEKPSNKQEVEDNIKLAKKQEVEDNIKLAKKQEVEDNIKLAKIEMDLPEPPINKITNESSDSDSGEGDDNGELDEGKLIDVDETEDTAPSVDELLDEGACLGW